MKFKLSIIFLSLCMFAPLLGLSRPILSRYPEPANVEKATRFSEEFLLRGNVERALREISRREDDTFALLERSPAGEKTGERPAITPAGPRSIAPKTSSSSDGPKSTDSETSSLSGGPWGSTDSETSTLGSGSRWSTSSETLVESPPQSPVPPPSRLGEPKVISTTPVLILRPGLPAGPRMPRPKAGNAVTPTQALNMKKKAAGKRKESEPDPSAWELPPQAERPVPE